MEAELTLKSRLMIRLRKKQRADSFFCLSWPKNLIIYDANPVRDPPSFRVAAATPIPSCGATG